MEEKALIFIIYFLCIGGTFANVGNSFWQLNQTDQFLLIFNFLQNDPNLAIKLLNIANASRLLLTGGKENATAPDPDSPVVYFALDKFAELLKNPDFLDIAAIVEDEVRKVKTCHIPPDQPDMLVKYIFANTNYPMILHRILHIQPKCITHS